MNCFPCFSSQKSKKETHDTSGDNLVQSKVPDNLAASAKPVEQANLPVQTFNFREIAAATRNFRQEFLLGEGGFGKVYKGTLQATGQVVAVKQLDRHSLQETREFLAEVGQLCQLQHPNLINLIGYCADGDQRLLVYEYMPGGSLPDHLFDLKPDRKPMEWVTRMKIAYGAAQALEYLHDKANPPVIYRDLKSLNVLLDEGYNPKLSDIGLSKLGPSAEKLPMQSRVMGTYGYSAPEYSRSGRLTTTADVYSFGVVLLELITGRKAIDTTKPVDEQNLVTWAQPIFKEPKKFPEMADPLLKKRFPERGLNQVVAIAAMCLQDESAARPLMSDVVTALSFLSMATEENNIPPTLPASISSKLHCISTKLHMQFMEHGDEGPLMKKEQSTVKDQQRTEQSSIQEEETDSESESDSDSDQDENEDDEVQDPQQGRARSSSSSSVSGDEKSASSNEGSAYYREESRKDSNACSGEESSRSSANNTSGSTKFNDASFSRSHKDSRESVGKDAYVSSSSSSDSEESDSHSHKRSSRKMKDKRNSPSPKSHKEPQDGNIPLRGDRSKKSSDAEPESVSVSNKSSWNSEDGNDYIESNRSGELIDENVSTSQKTSKEPKTRKSSGEGAPKGRKGNKKSSPREGNDSPNGNKKSSDETRKNNRKSQHNSSKVPNDESNASSSSPSSGKSNRKRTKKVDNSPGSSTSSVESQQEGSETSQSPNQQQQPATFTKASKVSF